MRLAALGFAAGAAWLQFQPVLPGGAGKLVLLILLLAAALLAHPAGKRLGGRAGAVLVRAVAGVSGDFPNAAGGGSP